MTPTDQIGISRKETLYGLALLAALLTFALMLHSDQISDGPPPAPQDLRDAPRDLAELPVRRGARRGGSSSLDLVKGGRLLKDAPRGPDRDGLIGALRPADAARMRGGQRLSDAELREGCIEPRRMLFSSHAR